MIVVVERTLNRDSECAWHAGPFCTSPLKWSLINLEMVRTKMLEYDGLNLSKKIVLISFGSYLIYLGSESVSLERELLCNRVCRFVTIFGVLTGSKPRIKLFLNISVVNYKLNAFDYVFFPGPWNSWTNVNYSRLKIFFPSSKILSQSIILRLG